jgi:hypothetical protein
LRLSANSEYTSAITAAKAAYKNALSHFTNMAEVKEATN